MTNLTSVQVVVLATTAVKRDILPVTALLLSEGTMIEAATTVASPATSHVTALMDVVQAAVVVVVLATHAARYLLAFASCAHWLV